MSDWEDDGDSTPVQVSAALFFNSCRKLRRLVYEWLDIFICLTCFAANIFFPCHGREEGYTRQRRLVE